MKFRNFIFSFVAVVQLLVVIFYINYFNIELDGLNKNGFSLLAYHFSRISCLINIIIICFSAGYWIEYFIQKLFTLKSNHYIRRSSITLAFLGVVSISIIWTILGLFSQLNSLFPKLILLLLVIFSFSPIKFLLEDIKEIFKTNKINSIKSKFIFYWKNLFLFLLIISGTSLLVNGTIFLAIFDPNIWEHYFHYYAIVRKTGSTLPNEVWHHFYASKGAGLIFLVNSVTDSFGAPIVNTFFIILSAAILFNIINESKKSIILSLLFTNIFLLYSSIEVVRDGSMYKHHPALLAFMAYIYWSFFKNLKTNLIFDKLNFITLCLVVFYLGFYLPVTSGLVPLTIVIISIFSSKASERKYLVSNLFLICLSIIGGLTAFLINYILTGLIEVTPMKLTWMLADQDKLKLVFGDGGVEFFLRVNNDLAVEYDWSLFRMIRIIKSPFPLIITSFILLISAYALLKKHSKLVAKDQEYLIIYLSLAFILPLSIFAQIVQTAAVDRMALYTLIPLLLLSAMIISILNYDHKLILIKFNLIFNTITKKIFFVILISLILIASTLYNIKKNKDYFKNLKYIYGYISAENSLSNTFTSLESTFYKPGIPFNVFYDFRRTVNISDKLLRLSYDTGYSYALPLGGIISEPTYSVVKDYYWLTSAKPEDIYFYLKENNLLYFSINLNSPVFSSFAYSSIFDLDNVEKYFDIFYMNKNSVILKLHSFSMDGKNPILKEYMHVFNIKKSGMLSYPFNCEFNNRVLNSYLSSNINYSFVNNKKIILDILINEMLIRKLDHTTTNQLTELFEAILDELQYENNLFIYSFNLNGNLSDLKYMSPGEYGRFILSEFKSKLSLFYVRRYGKDLALSFQVKDERFPFGPTYKASNCIPI